ncbi:MAG: nitroreductase [Desulfovibrio sp.]|nr:nitroreductase [Desulfovibrio sp.]
MSTVIDAIKTRRSIRKFKPDMPKASDIDQIVEAGLYAASGMNRQATVIIKVMDKELRDRLSAMNCRIGGWQEGCDPFYGAPCILIVLSDRTKPTCVYDGSLVMGNLMLAAHTLGLGSCWIHRAKEEFDSPEGKAMLAQLGIEGDWEGIGHCAIGFAEGEAPKAPPRREGRVFSV